LATEPNEVTQEEAAAQILGKEPTSTAPEDKSQPSTPTTFAERAATAEAELAAEDEQGEGGAPKAPTAETKPVEAKPPTGSKLKTLIDSKYGGDENKFADALYEQWNSASRQAAEIRELKAKLETPPAPQAPPPPEPAITQLDQLSTGIDDQVRALQSEQKSLIDQGTDIKAQILELRGEAKRADEMDKAQIEAKIDRLEGRLERLGARWEDRQRNIQDLGYRRMELQTKRAEAIARTEAAKADEYRQRQDLEAYKEGTRREFDTALTDAAKTFGLDPSSEQYQHLYNTIKAETVYFLRTDETAAPIDIKAFAQARAEVYAKMMNLAKQGGFSKVTQEKLQAGSRPARPGTSTSPAPSASSKPWTADFARKRAAKILG
jgi:Tfp pilus assembly protein PilN